MTPRTLSLSLLLSLLFATAAMASADLAVETIVAPSRPDGTQDLAWTIDVINNGPQAAQNVVVTASTEPALDTACTQTTIDLIDADSHHTVNCTTKALGKSGDILLHAHVAYDDDPYSNNNDYTQGVHVIAGVDVALLLITPVIDPGLPFDLAFALQNAAAIPATGITVTVPLPANVAVVSLPGNCTNRVSS
jgi:hypothetical protein